MNLSWVALSKRTRLASLSLVFPLDHFFFFLPYLQMAWLAWPFLPLLVALVASFFNKCSRDPC